MINVWLDPDCDEPLPLCPECKEDSLNESYHCACCDKIIKIEDYITFEPMENEDECYPI